MLKHLVEHVVKSLVDAPDKVMVGVFHDGPKSVIEIKIASEDFKRVIGKDGRIVKSLRAMIGALDGGNEKELIIDVAHT